MDNMKDASNISGTSAGTPLNHQGEQRLPDHSRVDASLRASVVFALRVYNTQILEGQLRPHIERALTAETVGQMRQIVASADRLLHK